MQPIWRHLTPDSTSSEPSPRVGHSTLYLPDSNELLLFAGANTEDGLKNDTHILRLDTLQWSPISTDTTTTSTRNLKKPLQRYEHAAVYIPSTNNNNNNQGILIFGGASDSSNLSDTWYLNLTTQTWTQFNTTGCNPSPRTYHTTTSYSPLLNKLFVFGGGHQGDIAVNDNNVYLLDIEKLSWEKVVTDIAPAPRLGHSITVINTDVYIFGGMDGNNTYNDLWKFDLLTNSWSEIKSNDNPPTPRSGHATFSLGTKLFIHGGMTRSPSPRVFDELWEYNPESHSWKNHGNVFSPPSSPGGRLDHSLAVVKGLRRADSKLLLTDGGEGGIEDGNEVVVLFGGMDFRGVYNDLFVLEF